MSMELGAKQARKQQQWIQKYKTTDTDTPKIDNILRSEC